ncbi:MAG: hypothetical protein JSV23_01745 [Promethearchaeota archaeon]|nr:MAG: hypothetical protein JSV23_01745 [Candidatus Lokiarchaeota archaeon]
MSKENFNINDLSDRIIIYHKGESFNINEILEGKLSGRTIALGDSLSILIKLKENTLEMLTKGTHFIKFESKLISNLEIFFELDDNNMNINFNPKNA